MTFHWSICRLERGIIDGQKNYQTEKGERKSTAALKFTVFHPSFFCLLIFLSVFLITATAPSELQSYVTEAYTLDMSLAATHIELRLNRAGQPRAFIVGTRVRVQDIYAQSEIEGSSPDEIIEALPHLTLGQVHAALSYYFDHRDAILQELREDAEFADKMRALTGPGPLQRYLDKAANRSAPSNGG